jgi:hypothetical protein
MEGGTCLDPPQSARRIARETHSEVAGVECTGEM